MSTTTTKRPPGRPGRKKGERSEVDQIMKCAGTCRRSTLHAYRTTTEAGRWFTCTECLVRRLEE